MSAGKHTPGPWAVDPNTGEICAPAAGGYITICDPTMGRSEVTGKTLPVDEREANASRIVQCVNTHDGLADSVRDLLTMIDGPTAVLDPRAKLARERLAAIAKATGSTS